MDPKFARRLIEKGVVGKGTEIHAMWISPAQFGTPSPMETHFIVMKATANSTDGIVLHCIRQKGETHLIRIPCRDVTQIGGMPYARVGEAMLIDHEGNDIPQGKRRGRPPRRILEQRRLEAEAREKEQDEGVVSDDDWEDDGIVDPADVSHIPTNGDVFFDFAR